MERVTSIVVLRLVHNTVDGVGGLANTVGIAARDGIVHRVAGILGFGGVSCQCRNQIGSKRWFTTDDNSRRHRIRGRHRYPCRSCP